jgi:hypothetical protein
MREKNSSSSLNTYLSSSVEPRRRTILAKGDMDKDGYRVRTHLIHGSFHSRFWDYNHHIIPPMSASAAYRLGSVHRGAQGFTQFASTQADKENPIYIYDRLDEPTR